jgi:hypothetical protein
MSAKCDLLDASRSDQSRDKVNDVVIDKSVRVDTKHIHEEKEEVYMTEGDHSFFLICQYRYFLYWCLGLCPGWVDPPITQAYHPALKSLQILGKIGNIAVQLSLPPIYHSEFSG